ncbi:MAG TPA: hypothetical protein VGE29_04595, partial [Prosthecobacter sp.]
MPRRLLTCLLSLPWLASSCFAAFQETWETGYSGKDATGPHVLAYWKFDAGAELKDSSGHGHDLAESGALLQKDGKNGTGFESAEGFPASDKPHALRVLKPGKLTPAGP